MQHAYHQDLAYYDERALGLLASARDGTATAAAAFERWDVPLTEDGARTAVARAHGLADWDALAQHVAALPDEPFVLAYRAIEAHDVDALRAQLDREPDVVHAVGTNDNDLLGMAGATCDERLTALLLERGADPTRANAHGWTPLHQAAYSGLPLLARMLLDAGAQPDISARGDGGTPLVVALFWGHRDVAEVLAEHSLAPGNLRVAAGLGRVELINSLAGTPAAGAHRGFYRPHGGFPAWRASDDPQEVVDEALSWAARNDRLEALDALLAHGVRIDANVYRGTALMWAAATGRVAALRRLIELGADPNQRSTFGGPQHAEGTVPLHLAAQAGHLEVIRVLLEAGADRTARDALFDATPEGWAEYCGQPAAAELLR